MTVRKKKGDRVPKRPDRRKNLPQQFKKGNTAGKGHGRRAGSKNHLTLVQRKYLASTGLTPLQFFSVIYRDELYDGYEFKKLKTVTGEYIVAPLPKDGAKKVDVTVNQRLAAAGYAAPYMHKKMPIAVEGSLGMTFLTADRLATLDEKELKALLLIMDKLGVGGGVESKNPDHLDIQDISFEEVPD